jgi:Lamin Tail Domain
MSEYRWGRASGGAVPEGAPEGGHGYFQMPESEERRPLWAVRSLPGADGSVRLGHLGSANGAVVGESEDEQGERVDEYEVLLDEGTWTPTQDGDLGAAGALACGRLADATPLYLSLGNAWDAVAAVPLETRAQNDWGHPYPVLMAPAGAETPAAATQPAEPQDATGYRWASASGGEIPAGAVEDGHGSQWRDTEDGGQEPQALWLIRAQLPDGSVQLGWAARGGPARVGTPRATTEVDEYEVLMDAGEWRWPAPDEEDNFDFAAAGGVVSGRQADGSALYATIRDREGEGYEPGGRGERHSMDFNYKVLVAPAGAASGSTAPAAPPAEAAAPAEPDPGPAEAIAVVSALDLRGEVVEISNAGGAPLDLSGWKLHDEGSAKGYVFPKGTVVAAGGSVRVRSGPGAKSPGPGELAWKTASVWNDKGDTAYLKDPSGELVASKKA